MAPFAVYADDYSYIPIEDIEQYNAYKFWSLYGYNLDYKNTISYNVDISGTYTFNGRVTGSLNGQELTTYNISLQSTLSTLDNDTAVTFGSNGALFGFGSSDNVLRLYIDPTDNVTNYNASPMVCNATSYSTGEDWEYNQYTCTPTAISGVTGIIETPSYELTLGGINLDTTETGYINVNIRETGSASGGASGTINLNVNESTTGSGTISLSGTESTTDHKIYDIPLISCSSVNNSTDLDKKAFRANNNNPFVIAILNTSSSYLGNKVEIYRTNDTNRENNLSSSLYHRINEINIGGYFLHTFEVYSDNNNNNYYFIDFISNTWTTYSILPLYVGYKNNMSDKLYRYLYGSDRTNELLESGNTNSQQAITNNESINNNFSQASQGMHNIETTWENNLDTNLQNIPTTSDMYSNNKFIATANWVRTQFERIVLNTPFELLLVFSLILGIALVLIGKVR